MWHFQGVKIYYDPSYIYSGGQDSQPHRIYARFWRVQGCLSDNKQFDFGADLDRDPDPRILNKILPIARTGAIEFCSWISNFDL